MRTRQELTAIAASLHQDTTLVSCVFCAPKAPSTPRTYDYLCAVNTAAGLRKGDHVLISAGPRSRAAMNGLHYGVAVVNEVLDDPEYDGNIDYQWVVSRIDDVNRGKQALDNVVDRLVAAQKRTVEQQAIAALGVTPEEMAQMGLGTPEPLIDDTPQHVQMFGRASREAPKLTDYALIDGEAVTEEEWDRHEKRVAAAKDRVKSHLGAVRPDFFTGYWVELTGDTGSYYRDGTKCTYKQWKEGRV